MKMLQIIGFLHQIYGETGRGHIIGQTYKNRTVLKYVTYGSYYLFCSIVILLAHYSSVFKPYAIYLLFLVIFVFYQIIERQIAIAHSEIYKRYCLDKITVIGRRKALHYIYFYKKLEAIENVDFNSLEKFSVWMNISKEKVSSFGFLSSSLYILVITSLFAIVTEYAKLYIGNDNSIILIIVMLIIFITFFCWAINDYMLTGKKIALAVSQFVSWYLLEKKESYNE